MTGRFVLRRSQAAREQAQRTVEATVEQVAGLVALVTKLADRMESMPSAGLDADRDRRARVTRLRGAAEAGERSLQARDADRADDGDAQQARA